MSLLVESEFYWNDNSLISVHKYLNLFLSSTKSKLNENEFKARVKKIVPYRDIVITTKEQEEYDFELAFEREFYYKYEPKIELFGDIKRTKNLIDII